MNYIPPPNRQDYYEQIWELARQIPQGKLATYGQLGQMLAVPEGFDPVDYKVFSPRWVGNAMADCPDDVPWHRVVNSQGKISQWVNADKQKRLLENEGHCFVNGKLDFKVCLWGDSGEKGLGEQGVLF